MGENTPFSVAVEVKTELLTPQWCISTHLIGAYVFRFSADRRLTLRTLSPGERAGGLGDIPNQRSGAVGDISAHRSGRNP